MNENSDTIKKEIVWQGLKMELPYNELSQICQNPFEKNNYYDFEILLNGFNKALNQEISFDYYTTWCIFVMHALEYTKSSNSKMNDLLYEISDFFDGISFFEEYNKKEILYNISKLKYYNHLYNNFINKTSNNFETNGIERILIFDHSNWTLNSTVFRTIIKDNKNKEFDLKYVDTADFDFEENINYTFVSEKDFENIFNSFYSEDEEWTENHKLIF